MDWCTIESDPGVFTDLIQTVGVKGVAVEEIYSLEDMHFISELQPIYGFIFLFRWTKDQPRDCLKFYDQDLFFARQVIHNACGTQALLSVLLNNSEIEIGEELKKFRDFTSQMDSYMKGESLNYFDTLRNVHNSYARSEPFFFEKSKRAAKEGDDVFHFISYIPFKDHVYELDGLQEGPIMIGKIENGNWIDVATAEITKRMQKYASSEVKFNLLALCESQRQKAEIELEALSKSAFSLFEFAKSNEISLPIELEELKNDLLGNEAKAFISEEKPNINKDNVISELQKLLHPISVQKTIISEDIQRNEAFKVDVH